jgi:hypothetical protein
MATKLSSSPRTLLHLDPGVYNILAPWYDFHPDTPVPPASDAQDPLQVFIFEYMPFIQVFLFHTAFSLCGNTDDSSQPNIISTTCSLQKHNDWNISAFAAVLFGNSAPWELAEYIALNLLRSGVYIRKPT